MSKSLARIVLVGVFVSSAIGCYASAPAPGTPATSLASAEVTRLPTGQTLDPAGVTRHVGQMPLGMIGAPDGEHFALLLSGWRQQGLEIVDASGEVTQHLPQTGAFVGLTFSPDGRWLFTSGGNADVVYRYAWDGAAVTLADSIVLAPRAPREDGTRYPAGLALSLDGSRLYVAENLADSLAVIDLASNRVVQRLGTGRYPYGVAVGVDGTVFVSGWNGNSVSVFTPTADGRLAAAGSIVVGRHPSTLLLNPAGTRLFVTSGSTDRIAVVDTRARRVIGELLDPPPSGPNEGTTPNALALSSDGTRLLVAEGDANAVAVFDLSRETSDVPSASGADDLVGRIPVGWYPTALVARDGSLFVADAKGLGTAPNPEGPQPGVAREHAGPGPDPEYTLGQLQGGLTITPVPRTAELRNLTARVAHANGWDRPQTRARSAYPPFTHVIYVIKENRTYDQILGDLAQADGDTSLVLFGRDVTPNHHALAERFGIFDRFFVNAEVSADGHNWSTAAYVTDYGQKTIPLSYSATGGRSYDYEGRNRGEIPDEDVNAPAEGYLWDLALGAGKSLRIFGEQAIRVPGTEDPILWRGTRPAQTAHLDSLYAGFDLSIPDQRRADVWLAQFRRYEAADSMPDLQIVLLPDDHTAGARAGSPTPQAMVADNDLALGRMIEALSSSEFWPNTVVFVLEDDAQNGPDHVDSHRSPMFVISAYTRPGVLHRFTNTTDVVRTIEEILGLESLSQFDQFGRPLRGIWADEPDLTPYTHLIPGIPLDQLNPATGQGARESERLDLAEVDAADMELFNHVIWHAVKGNVPYPGTHRMSALELRRSQ